MSAPLLAPDPNRDIADLKKRVTILEKLLAKRLPDPPPVIATFTTVTSGGG